MNCAEITVDIDVASEGMVLSHNLLDSGGAVLLPAGACLSTASLASLRRRGIKQVRVQQQSAAEANGLTEADAAVAQAERERQCQRLQHLFHHSAAVGASARLLEHLMAYRKGN